MEQENINLILSYDGFSINYERLKIDELNNANKKKILNKKYKQVYEEYLPIITDIKQVAITRANNPRVRSSRGGND